MAKAKRKLAAVTASGNASEDLQLLDQARKATRSTAVVSISMTMAEKAAVEAKAFELKQAGARKDVGKTSGLMRVALHMMLQATDAEILAAAEGVENLEKRKGRR
jgi:hypothetical protein